MDSEINGNNENKKDISDNSVNILPLEQNQLLRYPSNSTSDYTFKILVIGLTKIGKTTIINQFVNQKYDNRYKPTLCCDYRTKSITIEGNNKSIDIKIYDIGNYLKNITTIIEYFKTVHCCIIVYDPYDQNTLSKLESIYCQKGSQLIFYIANQRTTNILKFNINTLIGDSHIYEMTDLNQVNQIFEDIVNRLITYYDANKQLYLTLLKTVTSHIRFKYIKKKKKPFYCC